MVEAIKQMNAGDVDLFFCMGGNFISQLQYRNYGSRTQQSQVDCSGFYKIDRSHLVTGETALIFMSRQD